MKYHERVFPTELIEATSDELKKCLLVKLAEEVRKAYVYDITNDKMQKNSNQLISSIYNETGMKYSLKMKRVLKTQVSYMCSTIRIQDKKNFLTVEVIAVKSYTNFDTEEESVHKFIIRTTE